MAKRILFVLGCILVLWSATSPTVALADAYVVIFSKTDQSLTGVSYSASGTGTIHHTICDLASGTGSYDVYQNSVLLSAVSPVPVSSTGTISFDTNSGGSFSVSQHAAGPDVTPPSGTVVVNSGASYVSSTLVTLTLSAVDSGSGMGSGAEMRFSNDNVTWSTPESYATTKSWTLSGGDGAKTVYARYKDAAGNWMSSSASDSTILDTAPPSGSVSINAGAAYAHATVVTLTLSATDSGSGMGSGAQMRFSNDNVTWSTPESYAATKSWTLTSGDGAKTVYVRYKDVAGNWTSSTVSDSITLDISPPSTPAPPLIGH
ncbi:hypothetical protein HZA56_10815 [Candidatus Poribacteria bacterium]|nr:hypothetical protein [Candidatus Poribacteria bacterium]